MSGDAPAPDDAADHATVASDTAALFTVAADHPSLAGHFPGHPIVPGVVLLDQVLQVIERGHRPVGPLRMAQAKFVRPLLPGQLARVQLDGRAPKWRFRVLRLNAAGGEVLLASGDIALPETTDAPHASTGDLQRSTGAAVA